MADNSLTRFVAAVEPCIDRTRPERFWDAEPAFSALVASGELQATFNRELQGLLDDPCHFGDWRPNEWILHRGRGFALAVSVFDTPRRYIHALPFYAMYAPLTATPLSYHRYRLPPEYRNPVFDPGLRLLPDGAATVRQGEHLALHTDAYAYDFDLPAPVVVVKLSTAPIQPLEWLFRKDSLQSWQANDADLTSTQLRVAADVLGKFAHQSSLEPLKLLTTHPHHAVRWTAIQNLGRINRSEAVEALEAAKNDPHPHIQRAAARTLGTLSPQRHAAQISPKK